MTLIELMIVILILGILAAIVVLGIGAFQDTGKDVSCKTTATAIEAAMAASYSKDNTYANWAAYTKNGPASVAKFSITVDTAAGTATCPAPATP